MSAILGILRLDGGPVDHHALAPLIEALQAYGPDRQGVWVSGSIGLGQLLMQITPEDAGEQQPLSSVSGRFSLVADVRLDNRDTLTERLGLSAAQGRTWTDSAFVLAAFEKWGVEAFPQLLGGLAGALWDTSEQRLYLVRDVMGERPLFYYRSERCFVFASAFQGLFAHPQVPRLLNAAKLADYLLLNANDRSSTVYTHIHRLSPGQALSIDSAGHCRTWQYDDLMPGDETRLPSDAAYAEALREQFERAVVRRLRCRKSVGSHLSSGLDSSSVACVAANDLSRQQRRLQAYTWVPAVDLSDPPPLGRYHDEGPLAHDIARHNGGIDLTPVRCEETPPHWRLDQFHSWHHAPCLMPYNGPWYEGILEHAAQDGNAVMLTGFGGNFSWSFSGEYDVLGLLQRGQLGNAARLVRAHGNASQRSLFRIFLSLALKPLLLRYAFPVLQGIFGPNRVPDWPAYSVLRPEFARATGALARATNAGTIQFLRGVPIASQRFRCKALQGRDWAADWGAALQAKYGVVMRDPTADVELVRFCLALPSEQYLNNGMQRSIAKRAVADLLPHEILHTRQRGYQSGDWLRRFDMGIAKMRTDLELFAQSPLTCQLLDLPRLRSSLDRWPQVDRSAPATFREYFIAVTTGFQIGRFIHWVEQSHA